MDVSKFLKKRGMNCPRCNGKMELKGIYLRLFSVRKKDNGLWAEWDCSNVRYGNQCLPFREKVQ